jgi:hypothetical protein
LNFNIARLPVVELFNWPTVTFETKLWLKIVIVRRRRRRKTFSVSSKTSNEYIVALDIDEVVRRGSFDQQFMVAESEASTRNLITIFQASTDQLLIAL